MDLPDLWGRIEADLKRAKDTLPRDADSAPEIQAFQEYLNHNELELACNMLEDCSENYKVDREFWGSLSEAAEKMGLLDQAKSYRDRM